MEIDVQSLDNISDLNAQAISELAAQNIQVNGMSWSSDGDLLALATDEGIRILNSENMKQQFVILEADWPSSIVSAVDFHPTQKLLLFGWSSFFQVWDIEKDQPFEESYTVGIPVHDVAYSGSGDKLAIAFQGGVLAEDIASNQGPVKVEAGIGTQNTFSVMFEPDTGTLIALPESGRLYAWNPISLTHLWTSPEDLRFTGAFDVTKGSSHILASESNLGITKLNTPNGALDGSFAIDTGSPVSSLSVHPQADLAAVGLLDGKIMLFEISSGSEITRWEGAADWITNLSFSPNGKLLLSGSRDGQLKVWGGRVQE